MIGARAKASGRAALAALVATLALSSAVAAAAALEDELCLECHDDVAVETLETSVHGGFGCVDCHPVADLDEHPDGSEAGACADCHEEAIEALGTGVHAELAAGGEAAACASCHGSVHELAPSDTPESPLHPRRQAKTCGTCHGGGATEGGRRLTRPIGAYLGGVHARALGEGADAPACSACHGTHSILPSAHPASSVHPAAEAETCGSCHESIAAAYRASIHGEAVAAGVEESPSCTDCHGEHRILGPDHPDSPVFATNVPGMTCGRCHGDLRLAEKFGMPIDRLGAYEDSYHGLASEAGVATVAQCASCHGIHDIRPSTDPRSHTHPARLGQTCGACHPGAGSRFALGPVHVVPGGDEHWSVVLARSVYRWLILLVIGGMVVHNLLDLRAKAKRGVSRPRTTRAAGQPRMPAIRRVAHGLLLVSFVVLVYTGFALLEPKAWWAAPIASLEGSYGLRAGIHRVAALGLLLAGAIHAVDLLRSRRSRSDLGELLPGRSDLAELGERIAFWRGRRPNPPRSGRYGYPEKVEYWAVVWGSGVMAMTGFALWAEDLVLAWLPKWTLDLATTVHLYEAILASLAILVWHFYFVIFDPTVYPMDPAWWTGRSAPGRAAERRENR